MEEREKMKKKALFVLMVTIISVISLMSLQATAVSVTCIDEISYTYEGMAAEKAAQIVKAIYGIDDGGQRGNILCIFGHSKDYGAIRTIQHKAYASSPRCIETMTYVEFCTRNGCDYFVITAHGVNRIICCP